MSSQVLDSDDHINAVIDRINKVYGSWTRDTTIDTMRCDWDTLYTTEIKGCSQEKLVISEIPSIWVKPTVQTNNAVIMYVHGGGFRLGSVDSHLKVMADIASASGVPVLGFNYRLMPESIYPAQLDDCYTIYQHLEKQFSGERIILIGDSAGGGLVAALLQKLKQSSHTITQPKACVLMSAWVDMTLSGDSYTSRQEFDPVHQTRMLHKLANEYTGGKLDLKNPLLSPLFGDLTDLPPTLIQVGDNEVGLDDSIQYHHALQQAGVDSRLSVWPHMIHVFQMFSEDLISARKAIREIADFIHLNTNSL